MKHIHAEMCLNHCTLCWNCGCLDAKQERKAMGKLYDCLNFQSCNPYKPAHNPCEYLRWLQSTSGLHCFHSENNVVPVTVWGGSHRGYRADQGPNLWPDLKCLESNQGKKLSTNLRTPKEWPWGGKVQRSCKLHAARSLKRAECEVPASLSS